MASSCVLGHEKDEAQPCLMCATLWQAHVAALPHAEAPPTICTPELNAQIEAQIAHDAELFEAGRQHGLAHPVIDSSALRVLAAELRARIAADDETRHDDSWPLATKGEVRQILDALAERPS